MSAGESIRAIQALAHSLGRAVQLMEVCGTHTMAAFRTGLRSLLPDNVKLLSGPGCPVCVTPIDYVDKAVALAGRPDTVVATFGDMIRVPGSRESLEQARARGARVRVVYSPLDALAEARANPGTAVVFLGVGFETTAPTTAWALREAARDTPNFFVLCGHKTMPRAMAALLAGGEVRVDAFLCPGHVSVIIGSAPYEFIPRQYGRPCVVAGFEAKTSPRRSGWPCGSSRTAARRSRCSIPGAYRARVTRRRRRRSARRSRSATPRGAGWA